MIDLLEPVTSHLVITSILLFLATQLYISLSAETKTPENVPWLGKDPGKLFAETRAHFSSLKSLPKWLADGYENVSVNELLCASYWS